MKMDRLEINETYYKNGDSAIATYLALRRDYDLHNRPTTQVVVKKFEETGMVTNIERPVHYHSAENIAVVSESVAEDSNMLIPYHCQELGLS